VQNNINPDHYKFGDVEVIDIVQHLDFLRGNAVKYLCRAGNKSGESTLDDLKKASYYVERAIEQECLKIAERKAFVSDITLKEQSNRSASRLLRERLSLVTLP
jgi:hypothetical protein